MLTKQQQEARKIGGSSAGAIAGINKYRSRYDEYLRMTGQEEPDDLSQNISVHTGNLLESIVARILHDRGYDFETGLQQEIHPNIPYVTRTLDGLENGNIIHEIKTADSWMKKQFQDDIIPTYLAQINHYALWPGTKKMYLHVIFVPTEMKQMFFDVEFTDDQLYKICSALEIKTFEKEPDLFLQDYLLSQYEIFMDYVNRREPPPAQNMEELANMFALSSPGSVIATDSDMRAHSRMLEIKKEQKQLDNEYDEKKFEICSHMLENEKLICNGETVRTWKSRKDGVRVFR